MVRIAIISDIKFYGEGLSQILTRQRDIEVSGIATNLDAALELISACTPHSILLDMTMPGSCQLADYVSYNRLDSNIVALAVSYDESNIMRYAEVGITCYVPREASITQLIDAIMEATRGECYCPPKIAACLLSTIRGGSNQSANNKGVVPSSAGSPETGLGTRLTRRERQVAEMLGDGLSNKQIACDLSIEVSTVKNHVHNVLAKLKVRNRSQAFYLLRGSPSAKLS